MWIYNQGIYSGDKMLKAVLTNQEIGVHGHQWKGLMLVFIKLIS